MRTRANSKDEAPTEGTLQMLDDDQPTSGVHRCPYCHNGADKNMCEELTSNYQRNRTGCCGTQDHRAFPPCNSVRRKCIACLAEGKGSKANPICEPIRGLCEEHQEFAGKANSISHVQPERAPSRCTLRAEITYPTVTPKPPMVKPAAVIKPRIDAKPNYMPPVKQVPTQKKIPSQKPPVVRVNPVVMSPPDLDMYAQKISRLSKRDLELVEGVIEDKELTGITKASLAARISGICTVLGIPTTNRHESHDRRGALKLVWFRYKELLADGKVEVKTAVPPKLPTVCLLTPSRRKEKEKEERGLLARFRQLGEEERALVLTYVKSLDGRR